MVKRFRAGVTSAKNIPKGRLHRGEAPTRPTTSNQQAVQDYNAKVQAQKQDIASEISEREQRIRELAKTYHEGTGKHVKLGTHRLDKIEKAKLRYEIVKLQQEVKYLKEAQKVNEEGSLVREDYERNAEQYAQKTPEIAHRKDALSSAKKKTKASARETRRLKEEYGLTDREARQIKREGGIRPKKVTVTKLPAERITVNPNEVQISPRLTEGVSFTGGREKQQLQLEIKEYEDIVSGWKKDTQGNFIAPSQEDYETAQKEFLDVRIAEAKYEKAPFVKFQKWLTPPPSEKQMKVSNVLGTIAKEQTYAELSPIGLRIPGFSLVDVKTSPPAQFLGGVSEGYVREWIEKPRKQAVLVGVGAGVTALGGVVASSVPTIPSIQAVGVSTPAISTSQAGLVIGTGVGGYYVYSKGKQIVNAPTWEEKGKIVGVTGAEITALGLGSYGYQKIRGEFQTMGRTEIKTEKLVPKDVLYGKSRFPSAKSSTHLKLFKTQSQRIPNFDSPMMYHATGTKFWDKTFTAGRGTSYDPGLFGSYGISPNFLRIGSPYQSFSFNIFGGGTRPGVLAVQPDKFVFGRYTWKDLASGKGFTQGVANVPSLKTEVEAILPPGTTGDIISTGYYTTWRGIKIPIDISKVTGTTTIPTGDLGVGYGLSSSGYGQSSLVNPASLGISYSISQPTYSNPVSSPTYSSITPSSSITIIKSSPLPSSKISPSSFPSYTSSPISISKISKPSSPIAPPSSSYSSPSSPSLIKQPPTPSILFGKAKSPKQRGLFNVQVKTGGKFKTIATGLTGRSAVSVGSERVGKTLSATFRLIPTSKAFKSPSFSLPKTIKQKKKKPFTFTEIPSARLDTPSEVSLIKKAKRRKKKK